MSPGLGAVRRKSAGGSRVARALGSHACCSDTGSGDLRYLLALLDRLVRGTSETRRGRSALAACAGAPKVANLPIVQPGPRARVESENYAEPDRLDLERRRPKPA